MALPTVRKVLARLVKAAGCVGCGIALSVIAGEYNSRNRARRGRSSAGKRCRRRRGSLANASDSSRWDGTISRSASLPPLAMALGVP